MKNFKRIYVFAFIVLSATIFTSCWDSSPRPDAYFTTDHPSYYAGETIYLENLSSNADHYKWELPNGEISHYKHIEYYTNPNYHGDLTFRLIAYSPDGTSDYYSKTVPVYPQPLTDLTFWNYGDYDIDVTFAGITRTITKSFYYEPDCGTSGCANFYGITEGTYHYYATDGYWEWESDIYINPFEYTCHTWELNSKKAKKIENPTQTLVKRKNQ